MGSSNVATQRKGSMDEAFTNSEDTSARSTAESTPIRTMVNIFVFSFLVEISLERI